MGENNVFLIIEMKEKICLIQNGTAVNSDYSFNHSQFDSFSPEVLEDLEKNYCAIFNQHEMEILQTYRTGIFGH